MATVDRIPKSITEALAVVCKTGVFLCDIPVHLRTFEVCMMAVMQNGCALQHVPAPMMCAAVAEAAVKQTGHALEFVPACLRTERVYRLALQNCSDDGFEDLPLSDITDHIPADVMQRLLYSALRNTPERELRALLMRVM